jgi:single-strand DNA-binding protein
MLSVNGIGNVTKDAELKFVGSQKTPLCVFTLAFNRRFKPKNATEWQSETAFVECNLWGPRGETLSTHLKKGQAVFVRGHMLTQSWENDEGVKHSKLLVRLDTAELINRVKTNGNGSVPTQSNEPVPNNDNIPF